MKFSSLLGGAVTFTTPERWQNPSHQGTDTVGLLQMTALYPAEEGTAPEETTKMVARIWLSASIEESDTRSLKERSDPGRHQPPLRPDLVILSDAFHGGDWRTVASKETVRGRPQVNLVRFGLVGKKWVLLNITLLTDGRDPEPLRRAVADFNAMCESLKIDGKNQLDTKLNADRMLEMLEASEKK